jgi:hypothetical protein
MEDICSQLTKDMKIKSLFSCKAWQKKSTLYLQAPHKWIQPTLDQKIQKQNSISIEHVQTFSLSLFPKQHKYSNYLDSICIVFGISNLTMTESMQEAVHGLHANTLLS